MRCRACKGNGVCVECDGTGTTFDEEQRERDMKISPDYAREQDEEGVHDIPCYECEGTKKCVTCDGTGDEDV